MSEKWEGPGWWYASDGKWYPPHHKGEGLVAGPNVADGLVGEFADRDQNGWVESDDIDRSDGDQADGDRFSIRSGDKVDRIDLVALEAEDETSGLIGVPDDDDLSRGSERVDALIGEPAGLDGSSGLVRSDPTSGRTSEVAEVVTEAKLVTPRAEGDRPISVTRSSVGPSVASTAHDEQPGGSATAPTGTNGSVPGASNSPSLSAANNNVIEPATVTTTSPQTVKSAPATEVQTSGPAHAAASPVPESSTNGESVIDRRSVKDRRRKGSTLTPLLVAATLLALLSGVLGSLWLRERTTARELSAELSELSRPNEEESEIEGLEDDVEALRDRNEQLERQLTEMSALVLELPAGRVTEVDLPFDAAFADESNGRLIAMNDVGEFVIFATGVENGITESGRVDSPPTGLFAAGGQAWVSSESGRITVLGLNPQLETLDGFDLNPVTLLEGAPRVFWAFDPELGAVLRVNQITGRVNEEFPLPTPVVDISLGAGSMWALGEDGVVYRVNTADFSLESVDAGEDVIAITTSPDALWTLSASDGSLRRIDPVTGAVLVTVPVGRDPIDVAFAGSSVWVGLRSGSSLIEVDTRTSAVVSRTELSSEPAKLFQGDGNVFVSTAGDSRTLFQIDSLETDQNREPVQDDESAGTDEPDATADDGS